MVTARALATFRESSREGLVIRQRPWLTSPAAKIDEGVYPDSSSAATGSAMPPEVD